VVKVSLVNLKAPGPVKVAVSAKSGGKPPVKEIPVENAGP